MAKNPDLHLSRRERQIMNVLFREGEATVTEIAGDIPDPPSDTAIRTLLRILEEKGHVQSTREGRRNVYRPAMSRKRAARSALSNVLGTFFGSTSTLTSRRGPTARRPSAASCFSRIGKSM